MKEDEFVRGKKEDCVMDGRNQTRREFLGKGVCATAAAAAFPAIVPARVLGAEARGSGPFVWGLRIFVFVF